MSCIDYNGLRGYGNTNASSYIELDALGET